MIDGLSRDQRFFLSWARVWRGNIRDKAQLVRLNTDPHAPAKFRAIGAPSNMPAFAEAFGCKAGDPMVRPDDQQIGGAAGRERAGQVGEVSVGAGTVNKKKSQV